MSLDVLYFDNHCVVVVKPARLLTASDKTGDETLLSRVRAWDEVVRTAEGKKPYVAPLHFLDRPVSGVVMYARSSKAAARLSQQLREHKIEKIYHAIVEGRPATEAAVLDDWLLKDHEANHVTVVRPGTPGAKASRLAYKQLDVSGPLTWLEVRPQTGRSHQIRVQLSSRGMSIYGDRKYGATTAWDGVIALHALEVRFAHPVTKELVVVHCPVPSVWNEIWPRGKHV